jgi:hypothetical protein
MDLGAGGAGVISPMFMPRGARVVLRIWAVADRDGEPLIELPGKVVRTIMTDRRPAYMVGVGFDQFSPEQEASVEALITRLAGREEGDETG